MALCCPASTSDVLVSQGEAPGTEHQHAPINFLYGHLHDSIRTELQNLSTWALQLEASSEQDLVHRLLHLKERYHFLEQVYKYHSSVEDEVRAVQHTTTIFCQNDTFSATSTSTPPAQHSTAQATTDSGSSSRRAHCPLLHGFLQVVYPALDTKVKNVTSAYSVEHQDEVRLPFLQHMGLAGTLLYL